MSYSFNVKAATKELALQGVAKELDDVVLAQPIHSADRQQAYAVAEAFLEILPSNVDGKEFSISMHGSIGWNEDKSINGAGVGVSASLVDAVAASPVGGEPQPG